MAFLLNSDFFDNLSYKHIAPNGAKTNKLDDLFWKVVYCEKIKIMNFLRKIITNPIAIAFAVVNWILIILVGIDGEPFMKRSLDSHFVESDFHFLVSVINIPAFLMTYLSVYPILETFKNNVLVGILGISIFVFFVSFQWLLVGYVVSLIINRLKYKETKFSLK